MADAPVTVLRFVSGKYAGHDFPIDKDAFVAGRSTEADLVLADDAVSRKHARFYLKRGRAWVRDLGSRNGTLVNGTAVAHHCLREGDRLVIGSSLCRVERARASELSHRPAGEQKRRSANEHAGRSMTGSLQEIPLMDVLQWLATSRKTGALVVQDMAGARRGTLHLKDGRVFAATIAGNEDLRPEKAVLRMMRWQDGLFELQSHALGEAPPPGIDMSLEHMLMEAARQQDELADLAKKIPLPGSRDVVRFTRTGRVRWRQLPPEDLDFVQDIVEAGGWNHLLDRSKKDDVTLFRGLASLKEKGVVEW